MSIKALKENHKNVLILFTRIQIEKTMLLFALVDTDMDYKKLNNSKKIRTTFLKQALKSESKLTNEFSNFLKSVEILDGQYRTPETHKIGRILGLIHSDYYSTSVNEILGFLNESITFLNRIIDSIAENRA